MTQYTDEIQRLVNTALAEIGAEHKSGKVANAPIPNTHYLVRWVTKAIKGQRFETCVAKDLIRWQKAGRSKGTNAMLMETFERISKFYAEFFPEGEDERVLKDSQIEAFLEVMEKEGWDVSTSEPIVNCGKIQFFTEGQNSLALCANQCDDSFDGEVMHKPMNWFVRGNHAQFVEMASKAGFMVHKVTDYKSNVKYHGEYIIYPANRGNQLAEIPLGFKA